MAAQRKVALEFLPGIVKVDSEYSAKGRYTDCDKCRFIAGLFEKIGGWVAWTTDLFTGIARSIFAWDDNSSSQWVSVGTHCRLWAYDDGKIKINITPFRETGTLGANPFATVAGANIITVTDTGHGLIAGDFVNFSGATAVGGLAIAGEYRVATVIDANTYTIMQPNIANTPIGLLLVLTHTISGNATSTAVGGGASVAYSYELTCGNLGVSSGGGWGIGGWGEGAWGVDHPSGSFITLPRFWSLDKYGQNLLALPTGGTLYQWNPTTPNTRAAAVTNAPASGLFMFVTSERHVHVLGAGGNLMKMDWCDDDDVTVWTPSATNSANTRTLQHGSRLIGGIELQQRVSIIWSDTTVYIHQYTGSNFVYETRAIAHGCGLAGPGAFDVAGGVAFWMSGDDFWYCGGAAADRIPRSVEIRKFVFDALADDTKYKIECGYNPTHNEIWWHYCADGAAENNRYVAVSLDTFDWFIGTLGRTAQGIQASINNLILAADVNGNIFEHESGVNANGAALPYYIESGYADIDDGNVEMDISGFFPDFKRQAGDVTLDFSTKNYPNDTAATESATRTMSVGQGTVDVWMVGRQARVKYSGSALGSDIRGGRQRVEISTAGGRR